MAEKIKYIETSEHSLIAGAEKPLAPGGRVPVNEDSDAHKQLLKLIEAEDESVSHLSLVEVEPGAEKKAQEEQQEMLEKAREIAAKQRNEEAQEAQKQLEEQQTVAEQQSPHSDPTDFPPQDVEAQVLAKESGPGQRASTQEDVVDEGGSKSRSRKAKG